MTNAYYDIEIDPETVMPVKLTVTVLTGQKGETLTKGKKIIGGKHVAFHFEYNLTGFGKTKVEVESGAAKFLR